MCIFRIALYRARMCRCCRYAGLGEKHALEETVVTAGAAGMPA